MNRYFVQDGILTVENDLFSTTFSGVASASSRPVTDCLSVPYLEITAEKIDGSKGCYCLWEDLPVVRMPEYREETLLTLEGEHWIIRNIKLAAFTDENDTLTEEGRAHLFQRNLKPRTGEIFFFEDPETDRALVIVSEAPDFQTTTLTVKKGAVVVENGGNGLMLGFCKRGECEALCRNYCRHAMNRTSLETMSNTWGDRNSTARVRLDFVLREVDAAEDMGVDIVQIDDGWQLGSTATCPRDEKRRRIFAGDYWLHDPDRFPEGLAPVSAAAAEKGIKVGMWFAPDSHDDFALLERDIAVLRKAYFEWGIRFFKLDMYWVSTPTEQRAMLRLLKAIYEFGDDVSVQMDVTRNLRLNYLCGREYGTVFVENRYTYTANSFPHRILRNLWTIGRYLPASRFQFELINPDLYSEKYRPEDPFAPQKYDMDYLFASVMLSNPLFWMEMQFLARERRDQLKRVMPQWKKHRQALATGDVMPIGDLPTGRSFTGFCVSSGERAEYLLLFREVTDGDTFEFSAPVNGGTPEILASNGTVSVELSHGTVRATFSKPRCYAFVKIN